ncbi:hypothetical protein [Streptomyces sp. NPDC085932]|uniref:hypothetical protein n=1 Tax=Streptomyces sp. NPDC085932 TaxID=3365741 RepID=UPI0037D5AFCA
MRVTWDLLGIADVDVALFRSWAEIIPSLTHCGAQDVDHALQDMDDYLRAQLEAKRSAPRDDMLSTIVAAQDAGELTDPQALNLARLMFFAGPNSTTEIIVPGYEGAHEPPGAVGKTRR